MQFEGAVQVARRSDMDMNGHINNVTYLAWALETVPIDIYLNYKLSQVWHLFIVFSAACKTVAKKTLCTSRMNGRKTQSWKNANAIS